MAKFQVLDSSFTLVNEPYTEGIILCWFKAFQKWRMSSLRRYCPSQTSATNNLVSDTFSILKWFDFYLILVNYHLYSQVLFLGHALLIILSVEQGNFLPFRKFSFWGCFTGPYILPSAIVVETLSPAGDIKNCYIYQESKFCFSYMGLVQIGRDRKVAYYAVQGNSNLLHQLLSALIWCNVRGKVNTHQ